MKWDITIYLQIIAISLIPIAIVLPLDISANSDLGIDMELLSQYYDKIDPIIINGTSVSYNNYSGKGTFDNPIVIDRIWINNSDLPGISILNSDMYIVINDSFISYGGWHGSSGIEIINSTNVSIKSSRIDACSNGILIKNSKDLRILNVETYNNDINILVEGSSQVKIENSSIAGSLIDGIRIDNSCSVIVRNCSFMLNCGRIANDGSFTIISSNYIEMDQCRISGTGGHGIIIIGAEGTDPSGHILIRNGSITGSGYGILSSWAENVTISDMEMKWNQKGMDISNCRSVNISDCSLRWNDIGLHITSTEDLRLIYSTIRNDKQGLVLDGVLDSRISNNVFLQNGDMNIAVNDMISSGNTFLANQIDPSKKNGIGVIDNGSINDWTGNIWNLTGIRSIVANGTVMIPGSAGSMDPDPKVMIIEMDEEDEVDENEVDLKISLIEIAAIFLMIGAFHFLKRKWFHFNFNL